NNKLDYKKLKLFEIIKKSLISSLRIKIAKYNTILSYFLYLITRTYTKRFIYRKLYYY
ncbi:hypothetical protein CCUS01_12490, partial [Colletotrichum cuscutae]